MIDLFLVEDHDRMRQALVAVLETKEDFTVTWLDCLQHQMVLQYPL